MIRDFFVDRLVRDLIGPAEPEEVIVDRPSDRYLSGIIFPPRTQLGADQDEDAEVAGDVEGGSGSEAVAGANVTRPSSAGLSFALRPEEGSLPWIFLRRLRAAEPAEGGGVTVFMRYTLRLLTIQQFQRAAALICACELMRADPKGKDFFPEAASKLTAGPPVSIGLWVGGDSTPNTVEKAAEALTANRDSTPVQLTKCPRCRSRLVWSRSYDETRIEVRCVERGCELAALRVLPVWTVDEDVFRELPSLIIGTVDKYAQIVDVSSASTRAARRRR
jgi:hypothetical protein